MSRKAGQRNRDMQDIDLVMIGEVVKPHGVKGEVKAYLYSEKPENFKHYVKIVLQVPTEGGTDTYDIIASRVQGKFAILKLAGVGTREAAEKLLGSSIWLPKDDFPKLDSGEYYWHQLNGLTVFTDTGQELGQVVRLFNTTAHDIMVVAGGGHEYMIPVRDDIIRNIDEQAGEITVSPPPGLLEINE